MEKIIVLFSVPIFLLVVLLFAVIVLAHYSGDELPAPRQLNVPDSPEPGEEADSLATQEQ